MSRALSDLAAGGSGGYDLGTAAWTNDGSARKMVETIAERTFNLPAGGQDLSISGVGAKTVRKDRQGDTVPPLGKGGYKLSKPIVGNLCTRLILQ